MARTRKRTRATLAERFPPSDPCTCEVCVGYCQRPGWWTVDEAALAIEAGYASKMMLEMSPDRTFGVLSPAFRGCEVDFARQVYAGQGCTFLVERRCSLYGSGLQPLECRHCHHADREAGTRCHQAVGEDWDSPQGRDLVVAWSKLTGFWERTGGVIQAARSQK